jgi:dTDP-4-dehydrorhamnose 3,5-epimerase-like enzyme
MEHNTRIIEFPSIGESKLGFISVAEKGDLLPFDIRRVYWTYYTPQNILRGYHAHHQLHQCIFAVAGTIHFETVNRFGEKAKYTLNEPNLGLYIPPLIWREIRFSHNAVLLCLASETFDDQDYIRNYEEFKQINGLLTS